MTTKSSYTPADGDLYGNETNTDCWSFVLNAKDVRDFLTKNSFTVTVFTQLEKLLPDWIKFYQSGTTVLGIYDLSITVQSGLEIQQGDCEGAPLLPDRLYSVFRFGNEFSLSVYGQRVVMQEPMDNKKVCIIVDICQESGGSVFLNLPVESSSMLNNFTIMQRLIYERGVNLKLKGIGISMQRDIYLNFETNTMQLWYGNDVFQYPYVFN